MLRLVLPIEPSGKSLLVWEGATCATHRTTGGQGVQLGWGQDDGGQSCALLVVWLWEPSPGLWEKGVASSGLWGGGESPSSHLFCFLLFCGALPLEAYAVAMHLLVCISPALVLEWGARLGAGFAVGGVFWWSWMHLLRRQPGLEGPRVRFLQNQGVKPQGNSPEKLQPRPACDG